MDEGDVLSPISRKSSSRRRSWRLWTMRLTISLASARSMPIRMSRPSITNKNPMPMSTTLLILLSGGSANSTNPSSIASLGSSCRTTDLASIPAVSAHLCSFGLQWPQQRRRCYPAEGGGRQYRGFDHFRHADLIVIAIVTLLHSYPSILEDIKQVSRSLVVAKSDVRGQSAGLPKMRQMVHITSVVYLAFVLYLR